jgi:hypothetical protein
MLGPMIRTQCPTDPRLVPVRCPPEAGHSRPMLHGPPTGFPLGPAPTDSQFLEYLAHLHTRLSASGEAKSRFSVDRTASRLPERSCGILCDSRANRAWCAIVGLSFTDFGHIRLPYERLAGKTAPAYGLRFKASRPMWRSLGLSD